MRLPWPPLRAALEARPDGGRQDDARRGQARHDARGDGEGAPLLQPVRRRASVVSPFDHLKASKSFALLRSRLDHVAGSARDPRRDAAAPRSASGTPRKSARPDRCARRPPGRIRPRGEPLRAGTGGHGGRRRGVGTCRARRTARRSARRPGRRSSPQSHRCASVCCVCQCARWRGVTGCQPLRPSTAQPASPSARRRRRMQSARAPVSVTPRRRGSWAVCGPSRAPPARCLRAGCRRTWGIRKRPA
jgi:hypothetical protein